MHSLALAGFFAALSITHAAVAAYCLFTHLRHRDERELLFFGLLNVALCVFDAGYSLAYVDARDLIASLELAEAARIAAAVFLSHYVLVYARAKKPRWALAALYGAGVLLMIAASRGALFRPIVSPRPAVTIFGLTLDDVTAPASPLGHLVALFWLGSVLFALVALARALARGRREGLALAGVVFFGATAIFDAGRRMGWVVGPPLGPFGAAAFVLGVMMTLLSRFAALRRQLEARAAELKTRARVLSRAYEELRAAQDVIVRKEQLAAVGELSAVIAHEVRNPLAIISNAVATLRRRDVAAADRETLLQILDEESSRLNRIVSDLLRFARPITIDPQPVPLRELAERALALAQGKPAITVELRESEPVGRVMGDASLLRQVFDNLVSNAVQAMPEGGALLISLAQAELEGARGVEVEVKDSGEGMDTQIRQRALDPFFTTRPSGTGLGLAIVARIIDAHGGRLTIESEPGVGTTMRVFLPFSGQPAERRSRVSEAVERRSSLPSLPPSLREAMAKERSRHDP